MEFSRRKLPKEATENLRVCPIVTVQPFALMLAPVYVFMRMNEKFVAVKAPLDFFTPEELERLKSFEAFFIPPFVDQVLPFRDAARSVRALLSWEPDRKKAPLPPAPFEIADAVLRTIGSLWGNGTRIEPFFVAAFVNELCDLFTGETLRGARDLDVANYERALFLSSWTVFLALHLGRCDLEHLNRLRARVFSDTVQNVSSISADPETDQLIRAARESLGATTDPLNGSFFTRRADRVSQKLSSRLKRVSAAFVNAETPMPSILGERGFVDA